MPACRHALPLALAAPLAVRAGVRTRRMYQQDAQRLAFLLTDPIPALHLTRDFQEAARAFVEKRPPRYEYRLTPAGVALSPALVALIRWGEHHLADGQADIVLVHAPCGTEFEQAFWCRTCATTFEIGRAHV